MHELNLAVKRNPRVVSQPTSSVPLFRARAQVWISSGFKSSNESWFRRKRQIQRRKERMSQAHILANKLQSQSGRVVVVVVWQDDLTALLSVKASAPHGLPGPQLRRCLICSMFSDSLLSAPRRPAPTTDHGRWDGERHTRALHTFTVALPLHGYHLGLSLSRFVLLNLWCHTRHEDGATRNFENRKPRISKLRLRMTL